jgi:dTDP-4-amino-4,6-dideoxygalactose transaminase
VERVEARVTARTRAILPVHLFGAPAAPARLAELAARRGLRLIEDACQALGGSVDGRSLGTWGDAGCFSFFPSKPLGTVGDGGAVAFRDPLLFERARALRSHGAPERHLHTEIGGNYRLDELHAALLRVKLPHVETWRAARAAHARRYDAAFAELEGLELVGSGARSSSAHAHYVVRVLDGRRAPLMDALARDGVQTAVYYPRPLHLQPALSELGYRRGSFPVSERAAEELLALPLYAELPDRAIERIIHAVRSGLARSRRG